MACMVRSTYRYKRPAAEADTEWRLKVVAELRHQVPDRERGR
jgi:hypothetical protein